MFHPWFMHVLLNKLLVGSKDQCPQQMQQTSWRYGLNILHHYNESSQGDVSGSFLVRTETGTEIISVKTMWRVQHWPVAREGPRLCLHGDMTKFSDIRALVTHYRSGQGWGIITWPCYMLHVTGLIHFQTPMGSDLDEKTLRLLDISAFVFVLHIKIFNFIFVVVAVHLLLWA